MAIAAALALAGCGGGDTPAAVVPADATAYLSVATDARLPYMGRPAEALVREVAFEDVDFARDVLPWAGERVAVFARGSALGMAVETSDQEAAMAFARRTELRHARVIDGHLVLATTPELLHTAEESEGYDAPDEEGEVALLVFDNAAGPASDLFPHGTDDVFRRLLPADGITTARARLDGRAIELEVTGLGAPLPPAPSLEDLPGAAWFAIASGDTGRTILDTLATMSWTLDRAEDETGLDLERDVLDHLGPGWFFVEGVRDTDLGARLLAETTDEPALRRAARDFARRARRVEGNAVDLDVNRPGDPEPFLQLGYARPGAEPEDLLGGLFLEIDSGRFHLQLGEATDGVAGDLPDTPQWADAMRRLGGEPTTLLDLAALWDFITGAGRSPWVEPGAYAALRDGGEDGRRVIRAVFVPAR